MRDVAAGLLPAGDRQPIRQEVNKLPSAPRFFIRSGDKGVGVAQSRRYLIGPLGAVRMIALS